MINRDNKFMKHEKRYLPSQTLMTMFWLFLSYNWPLKLV